MVPLVLGLLAVGLTSWFNAQQDARQQSIEDQRAEAERELAEGRAQDEALQAYLDRMSTLLLEKDLSDEKVRTLMRARTLTLLGKLHSSRKNDVMQFLAEANLAGVTDIERGDPKESQPEPVISLEEANLRETNLRDINLSGADLFDAYLTDADLESAILCGADLGESSLRSANLGGANLSGANLTGAYLGDADLRGANLTDAKLDRTILSGTNLLAAEGVTDDQLEQALSLEGATMPDGQVRKGDDTPNGPTFEEWLKSEGNGEDGVNSGPPQPIVKASPCPLIGEDKELDVR